MENIVKTPISTLKLRARTTLKGNYSRSVSNTITLVGMSIIASDLINLTGFNPNGDAFQKFCYLAIYIALFLLLGVLDVGYTYFIIRQVRKQETRVGNLFYPYSHGADRYIVVVLARDLLQLIALAPAFAFYMLLPGPINATAVIIILGLLAIGAVAAVMIGLTFALVPYLLLLDEDYELTVIGAIQKSMILMSGNKLTLFTIYVSFAPYLIPTIGTMGIAFFWLKPYVETTTAHFLLKVLNAETVETIGPMNSVN